MSNSDDGPFPRVLDGGRPLQALPYHTIVVTPQEIGIVASRADGSALALALHGITQAGGTLPASLRVLRDGLDRVLTSRARPELTAKELHAARKARRDWLWAQMLEEERVMAAGDRIQGDLHPDREQALKHVDAAMSEYPKAGYVNQEIIDGLREGWQC